MQFAPNIGYHTRSAQDDSKLTGGSFGGELSMDTANRLVSAHKLTVVIRPSGTPVFVDAKGRMVRLYITVDAGKTAAGIEAMKAHCIEQARLAALAEERAEREEQELQEAMSGLSHAEILRRLSTTTSTT